MSARRLFTRAEANERLDGLRATLERIRRARHALLEAGTRVKSAAAGDGGGLDGAAYWEATRTLRGDLEALSEEGIILRDAQSGTVDFPAEREGREIYLCWRLGEKAVGYWHEVDAGFSGRRRL